MGKAGKTSGSSSLRWIFGFILIIAIIAGINHRNKGMIKSMKDLRKLLSR